MRYSDRWEQRNRRVPIGWYSRVWQVRFRLLVERKYDDSLGDMARFEFCVCVTDSVYFKWVSGAELSSAIYSLIYYSSDSHTKLYRLSREWHRHGVTHPWSVSLFPPLSLSFSKSNFLLKTTCGWLTVTMRQPNRSMFRSERCTVMYFDTTGQGGRLHTSAER